jgi:hypothetical protein
MTSPRARLTMFVAVAVAAAGLTTASRPGVAAATTPPRAQLTEYVCQRALDPPNRSISTQAVMRPLTGTRKLAIKFELLERTPDATAATVVHATGLGVWVTPTNPTLGQLPGDVWRLNKPVLNLDAPATYQFRVTFRWTGAHGKVIGSAVRYSRSCHQPELRPDLAVTAITVSPVTGHPDKDLYTATIADQGATGAGPFEVLFAPGDTTTPLTRIITWLPAYASRQVSFEGPLCDAANPPTITADATDEVDDYDRANNALTAVCPATTTPASGAASSRRRG